MAMALDEALLEARAAGEVGDVARIFRFVPSAVTIGRFQCATCEVDIDACAARGIDVTRRCTGGGAVFHDSEGEMTFSVVFSASDATRTMAEAFAAVCVPLAEALSTLGAAVSYQPLNDMVCNMRKISGSAQARRGDAVLIHGTVMHATRTDLLASLLTVSRTKLDGKGVPSVQKRVTTLEEQGVHATPDTLSAALIRGIEAAFGPLTPSDIPAVVLKRADVLVREKYSATAYVFER
ncbi:MAG: lipoate--protein ligase family protein [Candidatus Methanofastidiosa archaeon]|nr:lipoate--protein ligase family protein [Candidatus Methanofastidiosa archaeon]